MALRVGINGFGRIGRLVFRVLAERPLDFDVVAINDLSDPKHLALLLKYDSVQGRFKGTVEAREKSIVVNGNEIPITTEKDPAALPWKKLSCQVALESTGRFTDRASLQKHIEAGAERVVLSAPAKDDLDATIVLGVNDTDPQQEPPHHLQRVVHDQLPGADGQGSARVFRDREGVDDDGPRLHQRPARRRPGPRGPVSRPGGGGEHHPVQDRGRQGRRRGHPRIEGEADGLRAAGARAGRLGDRPHRPDEDGRHQGPGQRARSRRLPRGRSRASSSTPPTPWSPATSSATRIPASSCPIRPWSSTTSSRSSPGTITNGAIPTGPPSC